MERGLVITFSLAAAGAGGNRSIYELPPKYLAEIALDKRSAVLKKLSTDPEDNRLDDPNK